MEIIILIVVLGLIFDYTNGFHDAANVISTVIATKALTPLIAILLAGVLNIIGALNVGRVAQTISSGLIQPQGATQEMVLCAIVGAILWNLLTWYFGIPSSSSYALIGGLIGPALNSGLIIWSGLLFKVIIPMVASPFIGFLIAYAIMKFLYHIFGKRPSEKKERLFRHFQIGSASFVALSHGLNDAQKSMGLITLGLFSAGILHSISIPFWVIIACALMIGLGTASGGLRIVHTMGYKITKIEPIQGFAAETSASLVILTASFFGMPISSTHMIVGSIAGVGSARALSAVRWAMTNRLVIAWIFTIPGSALFSYTIYKIFAYFSHSA